MKIRKKHDKTWEFVISIINKKEGLEHGPVYAILNILRENKFKKNNLDYNMVQILSVYVDKYHSEEGKKALRDGLLATIVEPKIRN